MAFRMPADVRAVFFDAVGTILFPSPPAAVVYAEVAERAGLRISPRTVRDRFVEAYRVQELTDRAAGWVTSEERERDRWHTIVLEVLRGVPDPEACFVELFEHFSKPTAWQVGPDTTQVLSALRDRGCMVGLGSNYDSRLWSVLAGFPELDPIRDRTVISSAIGFRKPSGDFFREMVRRAGCEPEQVLFVGDDIDNDYAGATAAGLNAVLIDTALEAPALKQRITRLAELLN